MSKKFSSYFSPKRKGPKNSGIQGRFITEENYDKLRKEHQTMKEAKWLVKAQIQNKIEELDQIIEKLLS
jgi:hypothetical protein